MPVPKGFKHSEATKLKMRASHANSEKSQNRKPLTNETKKKLSDYRKTVTGWKHTEETKLKMSRAWDGDQSVRLEKLKATYTPERRQNISKSVISRMTKNGHWNRSKFEIYFESILSELGLPFKRQMASTSKLLNKIRYFDFYIECLNLYIEIDGEYWHTKPERIEIDKLKSSYALSSGHMLRISDKYSYIPFIKEWLATTNFKQMLEHTELIHMIRSKPPYSN